MSSFVITFPQAYAFRRPLICCLYDFEFPCRTNPRLSDMPIVYASDAFLKLTGSKTVTLYKLYQLYINF